MRTVYISDDNHVFTNLKECIEYESAQKKYVVIVEDVEDGDDYLTQSFESKQDCQHFVAAYIHNLLKSFESQERIEEFFYNDKISVYHKGDKKSYLLKDLIEEVPAHYKINSERFCDLIR